MAATFVQMSEANFNKLTGIIYERSGIHFPENKKYVLESRLARRLEELDFDTFDQYLMFLTVGPYRDDEFQEMFNRITINETSFFRNEPQLDYFEKIILPQLLEARRATRRLRIWSAACSTGEEPYTLAIQLHRSMGVRLKEWTVEILGTDISEKVLSAAMVGRYASYSIRSMNPLVLKRYFNEVNNWYEIDPEVKRMVHFEKLNFRDTTAAKRFGKWDVIFCRNVLIYFDDAMRTNCVKLFHEQLADDGTLFIGHSESLRSLKAPFEPLAAPQAFAYKKLAASAAGGIFNAA